jgi:hypothetical protein
LAFLFFISLPGLAVGLVVFAARKVELVLRDDEHDGAPPRVRVDLDGGWVVITQCAPRSGELV